MFTFALDKKRSSPARRVRQAHPGTVHGPTWQAHQDGIRHILRGPTVQPKLTIGAPNDVYEQEADRVADAVLRMPEPRHDRTAMLRNSPPAIQRLCTECEEELHRQPIKEGEEELQAKLRRQPIEEEEEFLQPKAHPGDQPDLTPEAELGVTALRGGGRPLPESLRAFFEPRFGHDFAQVRVHTNDSAAGAAKAVSARAFTVGRDVVFGQGEYSPGTAAGRRLLAHELTHVLQQQKGRIGVQRLVEVQPDATAAADILGQFNFLCPDGNFTLNGQRIESACVSGSQSCECLCDVTTDQSRAYVIEVHNVTNSPTSVTLHDGSTETVPMPSQGPTTTRGTHPTVRMPSSAGRAIAFGAFLASGSPFVADNWRILGHELCGHARLNQSYAGSKGDRPGHDVTIDTENVIAAEHGGPARGKDGDTRQGESFHRLPSGGAKLVFKLRNGWHHEHVP